MVKQVIIVRKDIEMSMGKAIAQGAHASQLALEDLYWEAKYGLSACMDIKSEWEQTGITKIVLACKSLAELDKVIDKAKELGLPLSRITDEGRTEFTEPTVTCGAIGPCYAEEIDKITKRLRLY